MTQFILDWIAWGGYLGIFLLMALENVVPPIALSGPPLNPKAGKSGPH